MTCSMSVHQIGGLSERATLFNPHNRTAHNCLNRGEACDFVGRGEFSYDVRFRNNADNLTPLHNEDAADTMSAHELGSLHDGGSRLCSDEIMRHDLSDTNHSFPSG